MHASRLCGAREDRGRGRPIRALVQIADSALYASKAAGRDRITVGAPLLDLPTLVPDSTETDTASGERPSRPRQRLLLHEAVNEEDPGPNGIENR